MIGSSFSLLHLALSAIILPLMLSVTETETETTPYDDAELYDVVFEQLDYGLDYYLQLARAAGGPILDLACGTGRVMLPCLSAGLEVDGVDLSASMLARLREKASAKGFQPRLWQASMASFALERRYALIMIPFNAFVHNLTVDDQIGTLSRCREHLQPGGLLAFDAFFPGTGIITAPENTRVLETEVLHPKTGLPVRLFDTRSFDRVEQRQFSKVEIEMIDSHGRVASTHTSHTVVRWIYKTEMELLMRASGFAQWGIFGGFDRSALRLETDGMVVEAWNSSPGHVRGHQRDTASGPDRRAIDEKHDVDKRDVGRNNK